MRWLGLLALAGCGVEPEVAPPGDSDAVDTVDTSFWDSADTGSGSGSDTEDTGAGAGDSDDAPDSDVGSDSDAPSDDSDGGADTDLGDTDVDPPVDDGPGIWPDDLMCLVRPVIIEPTYRWLVHPDVEASYFFDFDASIFDVHDWVITTEVEWADFEAKVGADLPDPDFDTELALASTYHASRTCGVELGSASVDQMPGGDPALSDGPPHAGNALLRVTWSDPSIGCDIACAMIQSAVVVAAVPKLLAYDAPNDGHTCTYVDGPCLYEDTSPK
jgi:hypothetical protein